jgi:exodeoxyribonuclease VII large subunit
MPPAQPDERERQGLLDFSPPRPQVFTVSELIQRASRVLEARFSDIWVEGEIEGFKRHTPSGHLYFSLKDGSGRVSAMMPRLRASKVRFPLQDGLKVRARGRVSLFERQGQFQLYVDELELTGEGELMRAFEELKARLHKEGLFAKERKRKLPPFPRAVGIVTSPSGAALFDILRVAGRRGRVRLLISPCQVQGDGAPAQICAALALIEPHVDVIIVGRGGGSYADLCAFNDEGVARAIARARVPVVSAVGHEVDFTIADFVADVRAATPSAAAEIVVPLFSQLEEEMADLHGRLLRAGKRTLDNARQRLDSEVSRGATAISRQIAARRRVLAVGQQRLSALHPRARLARNREALTALQQRLERGGRQLLSVRRRGFEGLVGKLDAMSPLRVLLRGYAVARDDAGHVITDASTMQPGDPLLLHLSRGELRCEVTEVRPGPQQAEAGEAGQKGET